MVLLATIPLLFTPGQEGQQHRLMPYIWNIGHIGLFFVLVSFILNVTKLPVGLEFVRLFLITNLAVLALGIGIETIQLSQGRAGSWGDIYKNCLGASLAILFHPRTVFSRPAHRIICRTLVLVLLLLALYPLAINIVDWVSAKRDFPVLSDFETTFQIERWEGDEIRVVADGKDNHVLQKTFQTSRYSNLYLKNFPPDWSSFDCLVFRVGNPTNDLLVLNLRIHDSDHHRYNFESYDRYNGIFLIEPGWQSIKIPLTSVQLAPRGREMALERLEPLLFYTRSLKVETDLFFDDFLLQKGSRDCQ